MTITVNMAANQRLEVQEVGDFFRVMESSLPITVEFYLHGKKIATAVNVRSGFAETFVNGGYDRYVLVNGATVQSVQYAARLGSSILYDVPPVGNVAITNASGAFTQSAIAVTSAGVVVSAANASRRIGQFINTDPVAVMLLTVDGSVPGAANGIPLEPGEVWENPAMYCPTGAIRVKSDKATATAVWVEG
jgi:hypothetical protein